MKRIFITFLFILGINTGAHAGFFATVAQTAKNHPVATVIGTTVGCAAIAYYAYQAKLAQARAANKAQFQRTIDETQRLNVESAHNAAQTVYERLQVYWNSVFGKRKK